MQPAGPGEIPVALLISAAGNQQIAYPPCPPLRDL